MYDLVIIIQKKIMKINRYKPIICIPNTILSNVIPSSLIHFIIISMVYAVLCCNNKLLNIKSINYIY